MVLQALRDGFHYRFPVLIKSDMRYRVSSLIIFSGSNRIAFFAITLDSYCYSFMHKDCSCSCFLESVFVTFVKCLLFLISDRDCLILGLVESVFGLKFSFFGVSNFSEKIQELFPKIALGLLLLVLDGSPGGRWFRFLLDPNW